MPFPEKHRKTIKHFHRKGDYHELTFSCFHRKPLLTRDAWLRRLSFYIDEANRLEQFELAAFVYMPEHVHLLVFPLTLEPNLGRYLARIKQPLSKEVKLDLIEQKSPLVQQLTIQERPEKMVFRLWQAGPGYDRNLNTESALDNSVSYLHGNPVVRKLCLRPTDWYWSSARYYLIEPPRQQFPGLPFVHGLHRYF